MAAPSVAPAGITCFSICEGFFSTNLRAGRLASIFQGDFDRRKVTPYPAQPSPLGQQPIPQLVGTTEHPKGQKT